MKGHQGSMLRKLQEGMGSQNRSPTTTSSFGIFYSNWWISSLVNIRLARLLFWRDSYFDSYFGEISIFNSQSINFSQKLL
jgi:hypothetical protein